MGVQFEPKTRLPWPGAESKTPAVARPKPMTSIAAPGKPPRDQVIFSSRQPSLKSDAEKLAATEREALALFSENRTSADLLHAAERKFHREPHADGKIHELLIFDGNQKGMGWVNQICKDFGVGGSLITPDSLLYGDEAACDRPEFKSFKPSRAHDYYVNVIMPQLYSEGKLGIYVRKGANRGRLMHELFHALQFKNGLPFATDWETDEAALIVRDRHTEPVWPFSRSCYTAPYGQALKFLYNWMLAVPMALAKRCFAGKKTPPEEGGNRKATIGEALRLNMQREKEVCRFLMRHGSALKLSLLDRVQSLGYYFLEIKLQELLSYRYD